MRILLQPPKPDSPTFEVDFQIQHAIVALHVSQVSIRGAGRFGDGEAAIILQRDLDLEAAVEALRLTGIHATIVDDATAKAAARRKIAPLPSAGDFRPAWPPFEWPGSQN
jgi:hypothetical protein